VEARARIAAGSAPVALQKLRDAATGLPQPEGDLALAQGYEALNSKAQAARTINASTSSIPEETLRPRPPLPWLACRRKWETPTRRRSLR